MRMIAPRTGAPEITIAEDQEQYAPLTVAVYGDNAEMGPRQLLSRWTFTPEERARIAAGEDLFVGLLTFGHPMQPISVQVGSTGWNSRPGEPEVTGPDEPWEPVPYQVYQTDRIVTYFACPRCKMACIVGFCGACNVKSPEMP